jgi:hypothetical protein
MRAVNQQTHVTTFTAESEEWYTPAWLVELVRANLGVIDLDPASCYEANLAVEAITYYGKGDNALGGPWHGTVFLNPPSSKSNKLAKPHLWARKLVEEYDAGRVTKANLIVKSVLGYNWYEDLYREFWVCHLTKRPEFIRGDGVIKGRCKKGVSIVQVGPGWSKFYETFRPVGRVVPPSGVLDSWILDTPPF